MDHLLGRPVAEMPETSSGAPVRRLRIALFSGNYNYVKDGANQALNRLVGRIEARGMVGRVYSPVGQRPAFRHTGTLVPVPSVAIPGRSDYRMALGLPRRAQRDLARYRPDIIHLSAPDWLGHAAKTWAGRHHVPAVASVHTRFETYFDYYRLGFMRNGAERLLRNFYRDLAEIYAPSQSMAEQLASDHYSRHIRIWSRGVDRHLFRPEARDMAWRRAHKMPDETPVIAFVGRLVLEKGLDIVAGVSARLHDAGISHKMLIVGDGPARPWLEDRLPEAIFLGFQTGESLARAYASSDIFLNPSHTETFGNVTLEAMACAVPPVAAAATGSLSLVDDGVSGFLAPPGDSAAFADHIATYITDPALRAAHGAQSLAKARQFDWDRINDAVIDRYLALAHPPSKTF